MQALQSSLQQQQSALVAREEEIAKLQKALRDREDEVAQVRNGSQKLQKVKDAEVEKIKSVMQKEKEDKLAKLTAAHNKRVASKEDEMQALRAQLTKEREKELQKLSTVHQKQLKARAPAHPQRARPQRPHPRSARTRSARPRRGRLTRVGVPHARQVKDDELAQVKTQGVGQKEEKIQKLSASLKETKQSLSLREQEVAQMRKQIGSAHKAEEEAKKLKASADGQKQKEESVSKEHLARLKGSIEMACTEERKKLESCHEEAVGAKEREVAQLGAQLKSALGKCQQGQTALLREREKVREALLDSGKLAEVPMQFSAEQEQRLMRKVEESIQDCSVEEVHWLLTKTFRSWLAQSYSECDEVCDALEAEQQRLKRLSHAKEQELSKMRAHVGHLRRRVHWVHQVFALAMVGSMATGCVGAWRAISTGDFLASVQVMGLAGLVLLVTVVVMLFGDGGSPPFPLSTPRELERDRERAGDCAGGRAGDCGAGRGGGARGGAGHHQVGGELADHGELGGAGRALQGDQRWRGARNGPLPSRANAEERYPPESGIAREAQPHS